MNRDDVIRMAREAGAIIFLNAEVGLFGDEKVERFATLVAAAEREACANMADECVDIEKLGEAIRARGQREES
jgi:hypothetical protein